MKTFGSVLKMARKTARKTLQEVADAAGISVSVISDIEHGRRIPPAKDRVEKIERLLGVKRHELCAIAEKEKTAPKRFRSIFKERPGTYNALLRATMELDDNQLKALIDEVIKKSAMR